MMISRHSLPQLCVGAIAAILAYATPATAQIPVAAEDEALVQGFAAGRLDVEPQRIVHVSPLPGDDGEGTRDSPRRDLIAVIAGAEAGTAIHLAPGVYRLSEIRDAFGHENSRLITNNDGQAGRPIVLRTDPMVYDAESAIAVLDFDYENRGDWSSSAFVARNDYWVYERFEMRRVFRRGFSVQGHHNTLRELHLHHANTDGTDNDALIVMMASHGGADNVVMSNYMHHVGNINETTDELLDRGSVNGGCYYTVTRLTYDASTPAAGHDATRAEWEAAILVDDEGGVVGPDGDIYVVGNHVHDCHYGLGQKNLSRGPYFFLSNYVHDVDYGVFTTFRDTTVRNNVIHNVALAGINIGRAQTDGPLQTFFKLTGNGSRSEVSYNTILRARTGLQFRSGWGSRVHHNLVVDAEEVIAVTRNQWFWWQDGDWPGIRGEFLIGDLVEGHPFYEMVPAYAREMPDDFLRMRLQNNCYDAEPVVGAVDFVQPTADITGMTFDEDYVVLSGAQRAGLFVGEDVLDFTRNDDGLGCGAGIAPVVPPTGDAGPGADVGPGGDAGPGADVGPGIDASTPDAGANFDGGPATTDPGGCACAIGNAHGPTSPPFLALVPLWLFARRRTKRGGPKSS